MKILHVLDISLPHRQSGYSLRSQHIVNTQKELGLDPVVLTRLGAPMIEQHTGGIEYIKDVPHLRNATEELSIEDAVIFTGEIPHDEVAAYYPLIDIVVIPRTRSCVTELVTPMKPYEAMAMRKAIVVSDVAALQEVVKHDETGLVFRADDVESLIQTCAELIENPKLRQRLGQAGHKWVHSERTWTHVVARYDSIYKTALSAHSLKKTKIPAKTKRRRIAFYSQHLIGVGHHFRNRQIVNELAKTQDVYFIDGGRPVPGAEIDAHITRVPLPPLRAGAQGIEPVDKQRDLQTVMQQRQTTLFEAMEQIQPDVFCTEFFPFCRWALKQELLSTITKLNQINPRSKIVCSLRDIPTRTIRFYSVPFGGIHHEQHAFNRRYYEEVVPTLNTYFDAVLVHGDPKLSRLEDHFPWVDDIGIPIVYTGFVSEKLDNAPHPKNAPKQYVLVSAGGGAEGFSIAAPCIGGLETVESG